MTGNSVLTLWSSQVWIVLKTTPWALHVANGNSIRGMLFSLPACLVAARMKTTAIRHIGRRRNLAVQDYPIAFALSATFRYRHGRQ